jgi:hypothetical protein
MFYTKQSVGGDSGDGRTPDGDFKKDGFSEAGLGDAAALKKYLLTYAHGHPYYKQGDIGYLKGNNWSAHARATAPSLSKCAGLSLNAPDQVLEVGAGVVALLDSDASYVGVVVRHGGTLLFAGTLTLRVQFILIESGGLFQAGSSFDPCYRFDGALRILLVHPAVGYGGMGCPASQYSYKVYAPGVDVSAQTSGHCSFLPYTGSAMVWGNGFGPKSICVGFNGNYHLAGAIGTAEVPYTGNWNAWTTQDGGKTQTPVFSRADKLSIGVDRLRGSYPPTWLQLAPGEYVKGGKTIKVLLPPGTPPGALAWWRGKEIVILACPRQYSLLKGGVAKTDGVLPLYLNDEDTTQSDANKAATTEYLGRTNSHPPAPSIGGADDSVPGVEVANVIAAADDGTLTLKEGLQFDHSAAQTLLHRKASGTAASSSMYVDTLPHVGLLTRNIVITSELRAGAGGCNVLKTGTAQDMAPGKAGRSADELLKLAGSNKKLLAASALPPQGDYIGPGGSVVCNNKGNPGINVPGKKNDVFTGCYAQAASAAEFCGSESPGDGDDVPGHWLWGTSGQKGCGTIHGGQHMFRNGCAISMDAVELKRMGTPGNFGSIAQYAIHFHLCGYARSFTGYLPDAAYPRELVVANCSIWLSLSRWVTVHGTSQAQIRNNVGFVSLGSGYFVEDGCEQGNMFEHNLGAYAMPAVKSSYLNPSPAYGNVATDYGQMSVFWLKNNGNVMARNVACCSPGTTIGFWLVPQVISQLRGPSALCLGSQALGLPGFGSMGNAIGGDMGALSQAGNNNKDGREASVSTSPATACWVPDGFKFQMVRDLDKCLANNSNNGSVPYMGFMENISYALFMLGGEMPEQLLASSLQYDLNNDGGIGLGSQIQDSKSAAQWMPFNGQTACTDEATATYSETQWDSSLPYQPLTAAEIATADSSTASQDIRSRSVPKILSGCLSFCTSGFQNLWGGTFWAKQMAAWLINCAIIDTATGSPYQLANGQGSGFVPLPTSSSTVFIQTVEGGGPVYNKMYPAYHNFICNGMVSMPPSPTLWTGDKTFFADSASFFANGEEGIDPHAVEKHFCDFGAVPLEAVFPQPLPINSGAAIGGAPGVYLYDLKNRKLAKVSWPDGAWALQPAAPLQGGQQTKFPFVCNGRSLRRASDGQQPSFMKDQGFTSDVPADMLVAQFEAPGAQKLGDAICSGIFEIPPNLTPGSSWP